jgi:hypothetical protein
MKIPLFFPTTIFVPSLNKDDAIPLWRLCTLAGVPCRATGVWINRRVAIDYGADFAVLAEPGDWGVVRVRVPEKTESQFAARWAMAALAYGLMDGVARESIKGAVWARPALPPGRSSKGVAMNNRERQRKFQKNKQIASLQRAQALSQQRNSA